MRTCPLLLLGLALLPSAARGEDWSRFRGPNGTGTSPDKGVPVKWAAGDVPFKVELPGGGNSSPVVVGRRRLPPVGRRRPNGSSCARTPRRRGRLEGDVPGGAAARRTPRAASPPRRPRADGERLFAPPGTATGLPARLRLRRGKVLWKRDLGSSPASTARASRRSSQTAGSSSTSTRTNRPSCSRSTPRTGKLAWRAKRPPFRACYSTPFVQGRGKERRLIVASTGGVTAYTLDGEPGLELRVGVHRASRCARSASPVAAAAWWFACTGDGDGDRDMIAVRPGGKGDAQAHLAWEKRNDTPYVPTLLPTGGYLFGVNDAGTGACTTRRPAGQGDVAESPVRPVSASPVLVDGKVYAMGERGRSTSSRPTHGAARAGEERAGRGGLLDARRSATAGSTSAGKAPDLHRQARGEVTGTEPHPTTHSGDHPCETVRGRVPAARRRAGRLRRSRDRGRKRRRWTTASSRCAPTTPRPAR